jgi:EmrB/QacA subfamily drug resistance transporter
MQNAASFAPDPRRWFVLAVMVAGQFMFVVDAFIVNVAIPSIRADLATSAAAIGAVIAIYQIAYATLVITGGRLGDIFGRRRLYVAGIAGFTAASVWCGLAGSGGELIAARLAQGAAAALMVPQVLATIHTLFPNAQRGRAFTIYGTALGLGGAVGFMLGGWLVSLDLFGFGWRTVFFVNLPAGLLIAAAALKVMPASVRRAETRLDIAGAAVLFLGLDCLIGPVLFGPEIARSGTGWAPWLFAVMAAGVAILRWFLRLERRVEARGGMPLIDLGLLADRVFLRGLAATACFYMGNLSFYLVMTLYMQNALGYAPADAGMAMVPLAIAFVIASRRAPARTARLGLRVQIEGCVLMLAGFTCVAVLAAAFDSPSVGMLALDLAVFGFGQGLVMAPLSSAVLATVRPAHAGSAAGILVTTQQIAGAAGVALVTAAYFTVLASSSALVALLTALAGLAVAIVATAVFLERLRRLTAEPLGSGGAPMEVRVG